MATLAKDETSVTEPNDEKTNLIENEKSNVSTYDENENEDHLFKSWGFSLKDLFKLASTFFKEQEGKALHPSYQHKVQLVAYHQQIQHGPFQTKHFPPLGPLDVIGRDRRQAWAALGDLSAKAAMEKYVELLNSLCPLFRLYVEAHKRDLEEKERLRLEAQAQQAREEEEEKERQRLEEEIRQQEAKEKLRQLQQKKMIQDALNLQTYHQFIAYAEQQCPGDQQQQALLITQLQEQHYQQYMRQMLQYQMNNNSAPFSPHSTSADDDEEEEEEDYSGDATKSQEGSDETYDPELCKNKGDYGEALDPSEDALCLATASMWTRKDIREFKESIRKDEGDGILKVGHGETVTVRVPTHADGTCLFWEFATDTYDIGFGVSFEWNNNPGTQVSVNISESEDDDLDDDDGMSPSGGLEIAKELEPQEGPVRVIIPVYRRDCHEEVYVGSHVYPGRGVYLLKFDNSYSLWRSKTLYYRVYYTR